MKSLAINMLTYEAEYLLPFVLKAVVPFSKEIRVIDTGSIDNTMGVLEQFKSNGYPIIYRQVDVQHLGKTWVDAAKNEALTKLINELKNETKSDWILRIDDDEIFPEETMQDIVDLKPSPDNVAYSVYFYHIEGDQMIDPYQHRNFRVVRLFKNIPDVTWEGDFGYETIAFRKHRLASRKYQGIEHPFLHLGELRTGIWKHSYRFHEPGHCGVPIPDEYKKYLPKKD